MNLLALTGPIYMLQIYDRVLTSRSEETLLTLTLLVGFLFIMMGLLDWVRGRVLTRAGAAFALQAETLLTQPNPGGLYPKARGAAYAIQRCLLSPGVLSVFDVLWTPLFLAAVFLFHSWLGYLAVLGASALCAIALHQHQTALALNDAARQVSDQRVGLSQRYAQLDMMPVRGLRRSVLRDLASHGAQTIALRVRNADHAGGYMALTKALRLFLHSAMLGLGAFLVLHAELTAGAMIAASILVGRALAPIEGALGHWPAVVLAVSGWRVLEQTADSPPAATAYRTLPRPQAELAVRGQIPRSSTTSGSANKGLCFALHPGDACCVLGPSGAGKSMVLRSILGVETALKIQARLGGVPLEHFSPEDRATWIGYLPQHRLMAAGTVAETIAGPAHADDSRGVIEAARLVGAHEMILRLPMGYNTQIDPDHPHLSAGQMQRLGLARAFFGDPVLVILDDPTAYLDTAGVQALNAAIDRAKHARKAILVATPDPRVMSHCTTALVLENGGMTGFGPTDKVLSLPRAGPATNPPMPARVPGRA